MLVSMRPSSLSQPQPPRPHPQVRTRGNVATRRGAVRGAGGVI